MRDRVGSAVTPTREMTGSSAGAGPAGDVEGATPLEDGDDGCEEVAPEWGAADDPPDGGWALVQALSIARISNPAPARSTHERGRAESGPGVAEGERTREV